MPRRPSSEKPARSVLGDAFCAWLTLEDGQRPRSFARCANYYFGGHVCILQLMDIAVLAPTTKCFTMVVEDNTAEAPKQYKRCIGHDGRYKTG